MTWPGLELQELAKILSLWHFVGWLWRLNLMGESRTCCGNSLKFVPKCGSICCCTQHVNISPSGLTWLAFHQKSGHFEDFPHSEAKTFIVCNFLTTYQWMQVVPSEAIDFEDMPGPSPVKWWNPALGISAGSAGGGRHPGRSPVWGGQELKRRPWNWRFPVHFNSNFKNCPF